MGSETKIVAAPGDAVIKLDIAAMNFVQSRLSLEEFGRIAVQIARAAAAKRPSELQRLLLTIVTHKEAEHD